MMRRHLTVPLLVLLTAGAPPPGLAVEEAPLTLEAALDRARARSLAVIAGQSRIEEARARARGARVLRDNPVLEGAVGHRYEEGGATDFDVALGQTFELGGRRGARIAAADASLARETAAADHARVRALREVASAFFRSVAAEERVRLSRVSSGFAEDVQRITERRHAAGDVAALDVNLAAGALAKARSEERAAEAEEVLAKSDLKALLAMDAEVPLALAEGDGPRALPTLEALREAAEERPEVRALEAELREAASEVALGKGSRWPDVTPSVRFEKDDGTNVLWGGLRLSLPVWSRGQEARAVGEARAARLGGELEAARRIARVEVEGAWEAHRLRRAAAAALDASAAHLEENATLARRSYEVGQIGLMDWLQARRETLETRLLHLARLLDAREAEMDVLAKAGLLR
jgi:cobalt-zinc-cadmium efflux system outer membrane protein